MDQLIRANRYHDKGQFTEAIKLYQLILKDEPNNPIAFYELALTYFKKNNYTKSLRFAKKAAEYHTDFLPSIYLLVSLNYRKLNHIDNAVAVLTYSIKRFPDNVDLNNELASLYLSQDKPEIAAEVLKKVISLNPYHTDSHYKLGLTYYKHDYKTPAFFALTTFLILEPDSNRSKFAVNLLDDIYKSGVIVDKKTKSITLEVNPHSKIDEGDYRFIDIVMASRRAEVLTDKYKQNDLYIKIEQLKSYLNAISQIAKNNDQSTFVQHHYLPFYKSIYDNKLVSGLFYYTHKSLNNGVISSWLKDNKDDINDVKILFRDMSWPANYELNIEL